MLLSKAISRGWLGQASRVAQVVGMPRPPPPSQQWRMGDGIILTSISASSPSSCASLAWPHTHWTVQQEILLLCTVSSSGAGNVSGWGFRLGSRSSTFESRAYRRSLEADSRAGTHTQPNLPLRALVRIKLRRMRKPRPILQRLLAWALCACKAASAGVCSQIAP